MKKFFKHTLAMLFVMVITVCSITLALAGGDGETYEEGLFSYHINAYGVHQGDGVYTPGAELLSCDESATGKITIPATLGGYPVSIIYSSAFDSCDNITGFTVDKNNAYYSADEFGVLYNLGKTRLLRCPVGTKMTSYTVPDTVTSIDFSAFSGCASLTRITVDSANIAYSNDEYGVLFNKDKTQLIQYPIGNTRTSYIIPDSVTSISNSDAFFGCKYLTSITIPDSVTNISNYAFSGCTGLASIIVDPENTAYSSDRYGVLFNKNKTRLIQYPIGNTRTSYVIPDSVIRISGSAFSDCDHLTYVTIPDSVTGIDGSAFSGCTSLTSITVDSANTAYSSDEYGVLFNKNKTRLIQYPIGNTRTSYIIPESVTTSDSDAFFGCNYLTSITIPDSATYISNYAFSGCTGLASVTIPDSVTNIGYKAFYNCYNLTDVYYAGTETEWESIKISSYNDYLINATIHFQSMKFSQTHTVAAYQSKNAGYTEKYFNGSGIPLDGSNGTVDMCIPGLNSEDDMIPQGITYYPQKNWILISAYASSGSEVKNRPSVIYALDFETGKYVGGYKLYNSDGSAHTEHVGGIAVSGNNLYITDEGGTISYVPLSELNATNGMSKSITFVDSYSISSLLNGASTSHLSYSDGYLWAGNFYHTKDGFDKPASQNNNSLVLGFKLSGTSSESEWNNLKSKSVSDYTFKIPNSISKIQGTAVSLKNNKMILMSSYGRGNTSTVYIIDISDNNISNEDISSMIGIPMLEGAVIIGDYVYTVTESASWYYNGYDHDDMSKDPTDVIWKIIYNRSEYRNPDTGILIEYVDSGIGNVDFSVNEIDDNTAVEIINSSINPTQKTVYDITMTVDGVETQPDGNVKIRIPLPEGYNHWLSTVIYVDSAHNIVERIPSMYIDGCMVFITDHFSYYAVVEETCVIKAPSTTTISYGDSIILHADMNEALPDGWRIEWSADNGNFSYSVSDDGTTCTITPSKSGDTTFTVTVYDAEGNEISKDEQTMTSKAGFFDKIIAFFKKIFGLTKIIIQAK